MKYIYNEEVEDCNQSVIMSSGPMETEEDNPQSDLIPFIESEPQSETDDLSSCPGCISVSDVLDFLVEEPDLDNGPASTDGENILTNDTTGSHESELDIDISSLSISRTNKSAKIAGLVKRKKNRRGRSISPSASTANDGYEFFNITNYEFADNNPNVSSMDTLPISCSSKHGPEHIGEKFLHEINTDIEMGEPPHQNPGSAAKSESSDHNVQYPTTSHMSSLPDRRKRAKKWCTRWKKQFPKSNLSQYVLDCMNFYGKVFIRDDNPMLSSTAEPEEPELQPIIFESMDNLPTFGTLLDDVQFSPRDDQMYREMAEYIAPFLIDPTSLLAELAEDDKSKQEKAKEPPTKKIRESIGPTELNLAAMLNDIDKLLSTDIQEVGKDLAGQPSKTTTQPKVD